MSSSMTTLLVDQSFLLLLIPEVNVKIDPIEVELSRVLTL